MYIVGDFANLTKIKEYEEIAKKLEHLDIAMLFLNAGTSTPGPFLDVSTKSIEDTLNVNALHPAYLSKVLLNKQLSRGKRSAIVVTSSGFGLYPAPGSSIYSSSKAFATFLGQGLNYELKGKIDVMAFICG